MQNLTSNNLEEYLDNVIKVFHDLIKACYNCYSEGNI